MKQLGKWMLGAAMAAATLGLGTTAAHAAQIGVYIGGGPAAYVPPCPGPGYQWVAGYYSGNYWIPGRWAYMGAGYYGGDDAYGYRVYGRDWDGDRWRGHDGWRDDHGWRGRDDDGDRGWHRGWDRGRGHDGYRERH